MNFYDKAIELNTNSDIAYTSKGHNKIIILLGSLLEKLGRLSEAMQFYERAI